MVRSPNNGAMSGGSSALEVVFTATMTRSHGPISSVEREAFTFGDVNVLALAPDAQPALAHGLVIAAQKKMHVASEVGQLAAVVKSDRARADDRDAEVWKHMA